MEEVTGYIAELFQNSENTELLWLATAVSMVISILLIWLVFRKIRLWYWKVNLQIDTLKGIDEKLTQLKEDVKDNLIIVNDTNTLLGSAEFDKEVEFDETREDAQTNEDGELSNLSETSEPEVSESDLLALSGITYAKSKAGKIYTEEELENLIKD